MRRSGSLPVAVIEVDFGELFTQSVRHAVPALRERQLLLLFDYEGAGARLRVDAEPLRRAIERLCHAAIEVLDDGFVLFTARVHELQPQGCRVDVAAAATGAFAPPSWRRQVLLSLQLDGVERMSDQAVANLAMPVSGVCPLTGGTVQYLLDAREGCLFSLSLEGIAGRLLDEPAPDAQGARAWLVSERDRDQASLERRLQRLGWATRRFDGLLQAQEGLRSLAFGHARPSLLVAEEGGGLTLEALRRFRRLLPPDTAVVMGVGADSPSLSQGRREPTVRVTGWPLSPAELRQLTRELADRPPPSGETQPAPLLLEERRHALVVDDNVVNQMVATGMLQALGFEVDTASDGEEAIDTCLRQPPDLVLMDLHMPGMDGLEATRRLRLLQQQGALPRFAIVAATADTTAEEACAMAGMDAHLPKPLSLPGLERQVRRLWPAGA